jgi:hypothetical protein
MYKKMQDKSPKNQITDTHVTWRELNVEDVLRDLGNLKPREKLGVRSIYYQYSERNKPKIQNLE